MSNAAQTLIAEIQDAGGKFGINSFTQFVFVRCKDLYLLAPGVDTPSVQMLYRRFMAHVASVNARGGWAVPA